MKILPDFRILIHLRFSGRILRNSTKHWCNPHMSDREANPRYKFTLEGVGQPEIDLAAARLKEFMSLIGYSISSEAAREGTAIILGYGKWPEMVSNLGKVPALMMTPETPVQNRRGAGGIPAWGEEFYGSDEPDYVPAPAVYANPDPEPQPLADIDGEDLMRSAVNDVLDAAAEGDPKAPEMVQEIVFGGPWSTPAKISRAVHEQSLASRTRDYLHLKHGSREASVQRILTFAATPRGSLTKDHWPSKRAELTKAAVYCYFRVCEIDDVQPSLKGLLGGFQLTGAGSLGDNLKRVINDDPNDQSAVLALLFLSGLPDMRVPELLDGTLRQNHPSARTYNMMALTVVTQISTMMEDLKKGVAPE